MKLLDHGNFADFRYPRTSKEKEVIPEHWSSVERKHWVILLFILTSTLFAARVAMPVCATAMAEEFNWNKADLGAAMGAFFWGYVTTQVLGGYFADKVGGDKVLFMSVLMWSTISLLTPHIAHLHFSFAGPLGLLTITRVMLGISQGVHYPSMMSLLGKKIPEKDRSLPTGIITAAANFGTLTCGGIGSFVLEYQSWEVVFYLVGVTALVCTYSLFLNLRKPKSNVISLENMSQDHNRAQSPSQGVPWRLIFSKKPVWSLIFVHICMNNCFYIMLSWLPTFFHEMFPNERGWIYNVMPWAMSVPSSALGGWISGKLIKAQCGIGFTRKVMQVIAMGVSSIFAILLPYCTNFCIALVCAGIIVSLLTFHHSGVLVNPQDIAPKYAGSVFGVMNAFGAIPGFLGVYLTGYILNVSNSWETVFICMAFINFAGVTVFVLWGTGNPIV